VAGPRPHWRRLDEWARAGVFDQLHLDVLDVCDRLGDMQTSPLPYAATSATPPDPSSFSASQAETDIPALLTLRANQAHRLLPP
jgi:hypothetical protein